MTDDISPIPAEDIDPALRLALDAAFRHIVTGLPLSFRTTPALYALADSLETRAEADDPLASLAGTLAPLLRIAAAGISVDLPPLTPDRGRAEVRRGVMILFNSAAHTINGAVDGAAECLREIGADWREVYEVSDHLLNDLLLVHKERRSFAIAEAMRSQLVERLGGPQAEVGKVHLPVFVLEDEEPPEDAPPPPGDEEEG